MWKMLWGLNFSSWFVFISTVAFKKLDERFTRLVRLLTSKGLRWIWNIKTIKTIEIQKLIIGTFSYLARRGSRYLNDVFFISNFPLSFFSLMRRNNRAQTRVVWPFSNKLNVQLFYVHVLTASQPQWKYI